MILILFRLLLFKVLFLLFFILIMPLSVYPSKKSLNIIEVSVARKHFFVPFKNPLPHKASTIFLCLNHSKGFSLLNRQAPHTPAEEKLSHTGSQEEEMFWPLRHAERGPLLFKHLEVRAFSGAAKYT